MCLTWPHTAIWVLSVIHYLAMAWNITTFAADHNKLHIRLATDIMFKSSRPRYLIELSYEVSSGLTPSVHFPQHRSRASRFGPRGSFRKTVIGGLLNPTWKLTEKACDVSPWSGVPLGTRGFSIDASTAWILTSAYSTSAAPCPG